MAPQPNQTLASEAGGRGGPGRGGASRADGAMFMLITWLQCYVVSFLLSPPLPLAYKAYAGSPRPSPALHPRQREGAFPVLHHRDATSGATQIFTNLYPGTRHGVRGRESGWAGTPPALTVGAALHQVQAHLSACLAG